MLSLVEIVSGYYATLLNNNDIPFFNSIMVLFKDKLLYYLHINCHILFPFLLYFLI